jgi:hypothetical protein
MRVVTWDDADIGDTGATRALLFDLGGVVLEINFDRVFHAWGARAFGSLTPMPSAK